MKKVGTFAEQYKNKLCTSGEAARLVTNGDRVWYSHFAMTPRILDEALSERVDELKNIYVRGVCSMFTPKITTVDPDKRTFTYISGHYSGHDRHLGEHELCYYDGQPYGWGPSGIRGGFGNTPTIAFIQTTTMDDAGYFNFGTSCSEMRAVCDMAKTIVVEVNDQVPWALGAGQECVHISEVTAIVEGSYPLPVLPADFPASDADKKIAALIIKEIEDGSCLQFGIGGMPNTIGKMIGQSDLKNLGIHSEMMADCFVDLFEAGIVTGAKKNIDRYKMTYTFAMGSQRLYDFINNNSACLTFPVDITNDTYRIAMNDNMIAINNAVEVDIYGQISSESSGFKQISGTGGQLDFTIGAQQSRGGKAFIALTSTTSKKGQVLSRIVPYFKPGTIVTVPRTLAPNIVTEYGIAQLRSKSTFQRAEELINIAHPDFRDDLIRAATAQKIWTRTNKIV
jgi:acyl-CoA hydrolase